MEEQKNLLTPRERQVLGLAARGLSNERIADEMLTAVSTVKTFVHNACVKLSARNRGHATILALKQGLLSDQDLFSPEEIADMWAPLGPDMLEAVAQVLRQRSERDLASSPAR